MVKNIINFSLKKPILNHFILLFIFILSIFSYLKIPKEIFPPSTLDMVSIRGTYAGASSDLLDKIVVEDIETELLSQDSVDKVSSVIKNGWFSIYAELKRGEKANIVVDDIKDIISKIKDNLPKDMNEPQVKAMKHAFPLINVAIYSKDNTHSKEFLLDIADELKREISKLKDLTKVNVLGKSEKQLLVVFNEKKIEALGLSNLSVINAISQLSSIFPIGVIKDTKRHYYLSTFNGEKNIEKLRNTILKINNKKILLKDIAQIDYKLEETSDASHFNASPNVAIGIRKGINGDSIELVKKIKEIKDTFQKKYTNLRFDTYIDTSVWIKNRLNTVVSNILFGLVLLFIALLLFINLRIAIIIAIGIPTSFMIGLISSQMMGYSLNMLSLLGALIALGMLVDEAIVVGENIYRHLEMGKDKFSAAIDGAMEMYPAVLSATATTIFAFLPILLMSGQTGKFMQILPIMISILLVSSLIEAFFFLPLHAKDILKVDNKSKKSQKFWDFNKKIYENILSFVLKGKYFILVLFLFFIFSTTYFLIKSSKFEFMPSFDGTQIYVSGSIGVGKKVEQTEKYVYKIEKELLKTLDFKTEVESISSVTGMKLDGKNQPESEEFYFQIFINLYERKAVNIFDRYISPYFSPKYDDTKMIRNKSSMQIKKEIEKNLTKFANSKELKELKVFLPSAGVVKNDFELSLWGEDEKVLKSLKLIKEKLHTIKGVSNIADDIQKGNYEIKFKVNAYGYNLGFSEQYILTQLKPFYLKGTYSKMFDDKGIVDIVFTSSKKDILSSLNNLEISIPNTKKKILLSQVVDFIKTPIYSQIYKEDNKKIKTITASITDTTSAEVFEQLEDVLKQVKKEVNIKIKGEEKENKKVKKEMLQAAFIAIILIFITLVWMFDSILKPIMILTTIPLSILGVYVGHYILGLNITMSSLIGMVGLSGVIVNDGIIMMDFIKKAKNLEELINLAKLRLRPILLTSITTIIGLSSLTFFASGQSLILQPMAVSLTFGILWATILNLYYIPLLYSLVYLRKNLSK